MKTSIEIEFLILTQVPTRKSIFVSAFSLVWRGKFVFF